MPNFNMYSNYAYILHRKTPKIISTFVSILVIILLILVSLFFGYSYHEQKTYIGYVQKQEDKFVVVFYMKEDLSELSKQILLIEGKPFDFKIKTISSDYYLIKGDNYKEIVLEIPLSKENEIVNNILKLQFQGSKQTLWEHKKKGWFS